MIRQNKVAVWVSAALIIGLPMRGGAAVEAAGAGGAHVTVAQQGAPPEPAKTPESTAPGDSLEAKMARRFPQKVKVGDLIGLPVLDDDDVTLGRIRQVVRSPEGKIKLIVSYSRWFGWFGRPVAVPIEAVAILARQIASLEMQPAEYEKAPTWTAETDRPVPESETIRIAITRR